jgi:superfamily II DNA or RNA helicase
MNATFYSGVTTWNEFTTRVAALTPPERGAPFELLVRHFLQSDPAYRAKLRQVWLLRDVPEGIREKLRLPAPDEGIDLIAETHAGEYWSVQAKYRTDTDSSLTHRELSTFTSLSFAVCRGISFGLICTTTERITALFDHAECVGDLTNETWTALDAAFFASLRESLANAAPPPLPVARTPLPHQLRAIGAAHAHYVDRAASRGKLISPCGSGKSLTACWIAQKLTARRVLLAVPSIALIRQMLETWMREALARGQPADWLCVCSDADVARTERAELVAHVHELGLPTTQPAQLAAALAALRDHPGQVVVLTTYQSSPVLAAAARDAAFAFDLAVLDEAHRTTGRRAKNFSHLLFDANLPLPRRLFMTATERRFQGSSDEIVSMDDPALYGDTFELLTFKAAIAATPPILCDYRILTIGVRQSDVARLVAANRWLDLGADGLDEVTAQALASLIALRRATREHGVQHTVSFHSSIARAQQFRDLCARLNPALPAAEPLIAPHHVNGAMGTAARQRELDAFLAKTPSLVTNARCLTEGVDVPRIDCVFFADPKGSTIEIVQAAGRALRLAEGKQLGYILLPLVVQDGATLDEIAETSAFKFVLFVLRALATHDDRIVEWFRATTEGRAPESGQLVHFDFGEVVAPLGVNPADFAKQIEVKCWQTIAKLKWRPFAEAREWARNSGINKSTAWIRIWKEGGIPRDLPIAPYTAYRDDGWIDWGDFLGFRRPATRKEILDHDSAREFAVSLGLTHGTQWTAYARYGLDGKPPLPANIPRNPQAAYRRRGWISWHHWLGLEKPHRRRRPANVSYRDFESARTFARSLKLSGQRQWRRYCRGLLPSFPPLPDDIPSAPETIFKGSGWRGYPDWLGTTTIPSRKIKYLDFEEARASVRTLGLKSIQEWRLYAGGKLTGFSKKPTDIPRMPDITYQNRGWIDWTDWLGSPVALVLRPRVGPSRFRDFESAREFAHSLNLKGSLAWQEYAKGLLPDKPPQPRDIPSSPRNVYQSQWKGWGDWLGTGNIAPSEKPLRPFEKAREFARTLGFRTYEQWMAWSRTPGKRPIDIPSNPATTYRTQGWINWPDFLQPPSA